MILEYAIINKFVDTGIPHKVKKMSLSWQTNSMT